MNSLNMGIKKKNEDKKMEQQVGVADKEEISIDLLELFDILRRKWWLLLLSMVIGGILSGVVSMVVLPLKYTSSAMLYVLSKETTLTSLADLQIGSQLTNDYKAVITSRPILEEVAKELDLDWDYKTIKQMVTIDNPTGTRILKISITDTDADRTCRLTNTLAKVSSQYIGDIMEMVPPKMIEEGVVAAEPSSPNVKKNVAVGAILLLLLTVGVLTVQMILNDTVQEEEDVERYLEISVLALIPKKGQHVEKTTEANMADGIHTKIQKNRKRRKCS